MTLYFLSVDRPLTEEESDKVHRYIKELIHKRKPYWRVMVDKEKSRLAALPALDKVNKVFVLLPTASRQAVLTNKLLLAGALSEIVALAELELGREVTPAPLEEVSMSAWGLGVAFFHTGASSPRDRDWGSLGEAAAAWLISIVGDR